jgi:hypothetical protein
MQFTVQKKTFNEKNHSKKLNENYNKALKNCINCIKKDHIKPRNDYSKLKMMQ